MKTFTVTFIDAGNCEIESYPIGTTNAAFALAIASDMFEKEGNAPSEVKRIEIEDITE